MKTRPDGNAEEGSRVTTIQQSAAGPPPGLVTIRWVVALAFLFCVSWTDCSAYTPPEEAHFNPRSVAPRTFPADDGERPENIGRGDRFLESSSRRGIMPALKRTRERDIRKPALQRPAPHGTQLGEKRPSLGFRPESGPRGAEQASREVGIYGWSDDLRRHAGLVFDREQRVLADRLTRVPAGLDSIKGLAATVPAAALPDRLRWPEFNAYEMWVAELLGL